ncbi:hypothetical protein HaLaN_26896, partial [Haematococcus lacustris]
MSRPKASKPEQIWDVDFESETLRELAGRSRRRNQTFTCRPSPPHTVDAPLQQTYSGGTLDLTPLPMTALRTHLDGMDTYKTRPNYMAAIGASICLMAGMISA